MNLEDLDDVIITGPQAGHTLKKVAEGWVNQPACAKDEEPGVPEVPDDGNAYLRKYDEWILHTDENNEIVCVGEAPDDGNTYGRKNKEWVDISSDIDGDLTDYTRRNVKETITRQWDFALVPGEVLMVRKNGGDNDGSYAYLSPQGKLILEGGNDGLLSNTAITFSNQLTREQKWPFDTKLQLTRVPVVKSDEYDDIIGLSCIGGGITFQENDTDPLGLINITPRGLDIKRVEFQPGNYKYGSIDWKITDTLAIADPTYDVRMRMENINIGGPVDDIDNEPGLAVIGNGMIIAEKPEDVANYPDKYGHVFVTPKFIDITRGDARPRIRFSSRDPGEDYRANPPFAEILGDGTGNLVIKCESGQLILRDSNGSISPSSVIANLQARLEAAEAKIAALEGGNE